MSRAFTKEDDSAAAVEPAGRRSAAGERHYVTPRGWAQLEAWRDRLRAAQHGDSAELGALHAGQLARDLQYVEDRLANAVVVEPGRQPAQRVAFGAEVEACDADAAHTTFRIVGIDEADPAQGLVSYRAPLARAALGAEVGDLVTWQRPAGPRELEIVAIRYPEASKAGPGNSTQ